MKCINKAMTFLLCGIMSVACMPFAASADSTASKAEQAINDYMSGTTGAVVFSASQSDVENTFDVSGYDLDQMTEYTVFDYSVQEHSEVNSLTETFTGYSRCYVPYENETAVGMIQLRYDANDELYVGKHTTKEALLEHELLDKEFIKNAVAEEFSAEVASGIQYLEVTGGDIRLAFFTADHTEYVMPFFITRFKENIEGITEGDIYTAESFMAWLGSLQGQLYNEKGEMIFGGNNNAKTLHISPYAKTGYRRVELPIWIYPAISGIVLLGILLFLASHRKKTKISTAAA